MIDILITYDVYCWVCEWNGRRSPSCLSWVSGSGKTQLKLSLWGNEFYWVSNIQQWGNHSRLEFTELSSSRTNSKSCQYLETDVLTSLVSYLFSPFVFIMELIDTWMEHRVKKILKKTAHLRSRYNWAQLSNERK